MTPRQIIQQISERRHLQSIVAEKVDFEHEKSYNVAGNTSGWTNKHESESNKEIKKSKLEELLANTQGREEPTTARVDSMYTPATMYPSLGDYLQGSAIVPKSRETEVYSPTKLYDSNKERQRKTSEVSFTTLYNTFKNANEGNRRARSQGKDVVPKPKAKKPSRSELSHENGYHNSGSGKKMSNVRGMAKKIHDKSIAMENIMTANEKFRTETKHFQEHGAENSGIRDRGNVAKESNTKRRIRLHIYVPTAEMNS